MTKKQETDSKEAKIKRLATAIANMDTGDSTSPTALCKSAGVHPDTGRDLIDIHDSFKEIGFETIRDKNRILKRIIKKDESLNLKLDIIDIKKELLKLQNIMNKIKIGVK